MKKYLILIYIALISNLLLAQDNEFYFSRLKVEDGLSQTSVLSILQDKVGFMWFGTSNGLNKYDGHSFKVFSSNPNDSLSISNNSISSMYEDKDGMIWIGTIDGILNKYNRKDDAFTRYDVANSLKVPFYKEENYYDYPIVFSRNNNSSITSIAEDENGNLWIGTWGKGLLIFNKKTGKSVNYYYKPNVSNTLSYNRITKILFDKKGNVFISTLGGGINRVLKRGNINDVTFKRIENTDPQKEKIITLYEDKYESLWIGYFDAGLDRVLPDRKHDSSNKKYIHFDAAADSQGLNERTVMAISQGQDGLLYVGTFGGGVNIYNYERNNFSYLKSDPENIRSIVDDDIISIYEDRTGILWIGTHLGEGISKIEKNENKFNILKAFTGHVQTDEVIWSVCKDSEGKLWIGTYKHGLQKYDEKTNSFKVYSTSNSNISQNHIRAILEDHSGNLWVGTYSNGLNLLMKNTNKFEVFVNDKNNPASIAANQIQSIFEGSDSTLWIGTFGGGLNYLEKNSNNYQFKRIVNNPKDPKSFSDNRVYTIMEDSKGFLWVGTFGGGINILNTKKQIVAQLLHDPKDNNSLSHNRVMSIYEDSFGNYWIGTYGGGLNKYNPTTKKFTKFFPHSSITSDVVYGILEDNNKNLWISSNNGLFKFNLRNEVISHYDVHDGIQSREFSGGAYFKSKDGELFFGGIKGLNRFYPQAIIEKNHNYPVVFSSIKIFNNPIKGEVNKLDLAYNENYLTFEFAQLDYSDPQDNVYTYMLEGLDDRWLITSYNARVAAYSNLAPGRYIFRVRGASINTQDNKNEAVIYIVINPPFWKRWWFILLAVLTIGGALYYLVYNRLNYIISLERLKSKLAADLHDSVGSGLTEISILSELASSNNPVNNNYLSTISEKARYLIDNMSDIVWVVNPKRDYLHEIIIRLKDYYAELLSSLGISFKVSSLDNVANIHLPMEYKQNLYLIFKEGINNSIKHSECKRIMLDVMLDENYLELILSDDGVGMKMDNKTNGNGIRNMQDRANLIDGKLEIISNEGSGTSIIFKGKITRAKILKSYLITKR